MRCLDSSYLFNYALLQMALSLLFSYACAVYFLGGGLLPEIGAVIMAVSLIVAYYVRKRACIMALLFVSITNIFPMMVLVDGLPPAFFVFTGAALAIVFVGIACYAALSTEWLMHSDVYGYTVIILCCFTGLVKLFSDTLYRDLSIWLMCCILFFGLIWFAMKEALDHFPNNNYGGSTRAAVDSFLVIYIFIIQGVITIKWSMSIFRYNYVGRSAGEYLRNDD